MAELDIFVYYFQSVEKYRCLTLCRHCGTIPCQVKRRSLWKPSESRKRDKANFEERSKAMRLFHYGLELSVVLTKELPRDDHYCQRKFVTNLRRSTWTSLYPAQNKQHVSCSSLNCDDDEEENEKEVVDYDEEEDDEEEEDERRSYKNDNDKVEYGDVVDDDVDDNDKDDDDDDNFDDHEDYVDDNDDVDDEDIDDDDDDDVG
ncbi:uncharacterized protein [Argopecten irradians]|uniref:uncharacterized protein n=1 Tax=Argopecten irradians TaxID=31199 RepID=UPI003719AB81